MPPDLTLELFRPTGPRSTLTVEVVRPLTAGDMAARANAPAAGVPALKRIRDRHHTLARNLASGMPHGEAAFICGISQSRISILLNDPAFKELVAFYRSNVDAVYADLHERLSGLATDAVEELRSRLEDDPEAISTNQLIEVTKMAADRIGYGPASKTTSINVNVDLAARLQAARQRVAERKLIEE